MVPLQAGRVSIAVGRGCRHAHTELLLDDLQDLLLIELLRQTLHRGQGLTTIALCKQPSVHVLRWGHGTAGDSDNEGNLNRGGTYAESVYGCNFETV